MVRDHESRIFVHESHANLGFWYPVPSTAVGELAQASVSTRSRFLQCRTRCGYLCSGRAIHTQDISKCQAVTLLDEEGSWAGALRLNLARTWDDSRTFISRYSDSLTGVLKEPAQPLLEFVEHHVADAQKNVKKYGLQGAYQFEEGAFNTQLPLQCLNRDDFVHP
ncbi:hypothetical protein BKA66DRAFT_447534 [Pyrenochaeta sp. MPI-SDFR-AT-0127]|nr:hypothetical protein BKA66DRAFT_447534 [Pyrenochaeta sp. MPI-SDFR-AT-0127]